MIKAVISTVVVAGKVAREVLNRGDPDDAQGFRTTLVQPSCFVSKSS
jgi:hypothetical protein